MDIFVRASVHDRCNLNCSYCPKPEGMENIVPKGRSMSRLTMEEYCRNLDYLSIAGVQGISFTGGEPTLNPDFPALIEYAASRFQTVELTTNGIHLIEQLSEVAPHLSRLKVSLDTLSPEVAASLTGSSNSIDVALEAIRAASAIGLQVGINFVLMKSNFGELFKLIGVCREINIINENNNVYVSVLDLYYSSSRAQFWEQEYVPISIVMQMLEEKYGTARAEEKFGCQFYWIDAASVYVRLKDSSSVTLRAARCDSCKSYCQEGVFALKHSMEGWLTICSMGGADNGVHLSPDLSEAEAVSLIQESIIELKQAKPCRDGFRRIVDMQCIDSECMTDNG